MKNWSTRNDDLPGPLSHRVANTIGRPVSRLA